MEDSHEAVLTGGQRLPGSLRVPSFNPIPAEGFETAALLHDLRSLVTAIGLYCDLLEESSKSEASGQLEESGVLNSPSPHYAKELRLLSSAVRRLLEPLSSSESVCTLDWPSRLNPSSVSPATLARPSRAPAFASAEPSLSLPVLNLADELRANQNLLAAVAGPAVTLGVEITGCHPPAQGCQSFTRKDLTCNDLTYNHLTREDLIRVLVNLVSNARQAMPAGGRLQLRLDQTAEAMRLTLTDNGPGIPPAALEAIFTPGYTTEATREDGCDSNAAASSRTQPSHRGLGLAIVRSIVTAAGGQVRAANRQDRPGAVFTLEFPLRSGAFPPVSSVSSTA